MKNLLIAVLMILLAAAGVAYGYLSAGHNTNPYSIDTADPTATGAERKEAKAWHPSRTWLPSYLVCTLPKRTSHVTFPNGESLEMHIVGYGHENRDGQGYGFASGTKKSRYTMASTTVGAAIGVILAVIVGVAGGAVKLRRTPDDPSSNDQPARRPPHSSWP